MLAASNPTSFIHGLFAKLDMVFNKEKYRSLQSITIQEPRFKTEYSAGGSSTPLDDMLNQCERFSMADKDIGEGCVSDDQQIFANHFFIKEYYELSCDLSSIEALGASKSKLWDFDTLLSFGERNYELFEKERKSLSLPDEDYMHWCLKGSGLRDESKFGFKAWAPRLRWINNGGSHRFSTAYYVSKTRGIPYMVSGRLRLIRINRDWLTSLLDNYDAYFVEIPRRETLQLFDLLDILEQRHTFIEWTKFSRRTGCWLRDERESETETLLLLIEKNAPLKYVARYWIEQSVKARGIRFEDWLESVYQQEDTGLQSIKPLIKGEIPPFF